MYTDLLRAVHSLFYFVYSVLPGGSAYCLFTLHGCICARINYFGTGMCYWQYHTSKDLVTCPVCPLRVLCVFVCFY